MINVVGSHELVRSGHVALDPHLLPPPADQGLVLLFVPHRSFLLPLPTRLSLAGAIHHVHDATWRDAAHRLEAYSPSCLEGEVSEVSLRRWQGSRSPLRE